jgi:hypothetical protein
MHKRDIICCSNVLFSICGEIKELWEGILTLSDPTSDLIRHDFPVPEAFPHVVWTLANR